MGTRTKHYGAEVDFSIKDFDVLSNAHFFLEIDESEIDDPVDLLEYYNDRCHGEKALLAATLYDAIVILSRPKQRSEDGKLRFRETVEWFKSTSEEAFSFRWICTHLQINPVRILEKISDPDFYQHPRRRRSPSKNKIHQAN